VEFNEKCKLAHDIVTTDKSDGLVVAKRIKEVLDSLPSSYDRFPMSVFAPCWDIEFPHSTNVMVPMYTASMMKVATNFQTASYFRLFRWIMKTGWTMSCFYTRYLISKIFRTKFANDVDTIHRQLNSYYSIAYYFKLLYPVTKALFCKANVFSTKKPKVH